MVYSKMESSNDECLIDNNSKQPVIVPDEQGEEVCKEINDFDRSERSSRRRKKPMEERFNTLTLSEQPTMIGTMSNEQLNQSTRNVQDTIDDTVPPSHETIEEPAGRKEKKKESSSITNGKKRTQTVSDEEPLSTEPHSQVSSAIQEKSNIPLKRKMEESSPVTNEGKVNIKKKIKKSSSITNGKKPIPILSDEEPTPTAPDEEPTPTAPDEESTPIVHDEEPLINQSQSQLSLQSSSAISAALVHDPPNGETTARYEYEPIVETFTKTDHQRKKKEEKKLSDFVIDQCFKSR